MEPKEIDALLIEARAMSHVHRNLAKGYRDPLENENATMIADTTDKLIVAIERLALDLEEANEIRVAIDGEYSHAFEVYYDIQDRYAQKRAAFNARQLDEPMANK